MSKNTTFTPLQKWTGVYQTEEFEQINNSIYQAGDEPVYLIEETYFNQILSEIEGRILTLVEATTDDLEKRNSFKSLVRQMIWQNKPYLLRLKKIK